MQQGGHIENFTECRPIINQQAEFLRKNSEFRLTYCPCCKERWFETEMKPGMNMCSRCDTCKNCFQIFHIFSEENDYSPFPEGFEYLHHQ